MRTWEQTLINKRLKYTSVYSGLQFLFKQAGPNDNAGQRNMVRGELESVTSGRDLKNPATYFHKQREQIFWRGRRDAGNLCTA